MLTRILASLALAAALTGCATHIGTAVTDEAGVTTCKGITVSVGKAGGCGISTEHIGDEFVNLILGIGRLARSLLPGGPAPE